MTVTGWQLGYCTNVHAGTDLQSIQANLETYAVAVRRDLQGDAPMGVGLWLPAQAAASLAQSDATARLTDWLAERKLIPYTINGFPYDNFHQPVVKHRVYQPAWWSDERRDYTLQLADILAGLLPDGHTGSISTLPIGWPGSEAGSGSLRRAADNLRSVAQHLQRLEQTRGRRIVLAIEPEPGCLLDRSSDLIKFFDAHFADPAERRYLTVCHDVCHAAVMFESQSDVLRAYARAGVGIGKVQVSSAIEVRWSTMTAGERQDAMRQLAGFAEDRYLHQTGRLGNDGSFQLAEDLPQIIAADASNISDAQWRVHFHVPIFLESFGQLHTSRPEIVDCLRSLAGSSNELGFTGHVEAETYAWSVLPEAMRQNGLARDIATEMRWLQNEVDKL